MMFGSQCVATLEYEPIRTKKKYTAIRFTVREKTTDENVKTLIDRKAKER